MSVERNGKADYEVSFEVSTSDEAQKVIDDVQNILDKELQSKLETKYADAYISIKGFSFNLKGVFL